MYKFSYAESYVHKVWDKVWAEIAANKLTQNRRNRKGEKLTSAKMKRFSQFSFNASLNWTKTQKVYSQVFEY